jgi:hypothetical protein
MAQPAPRLASAPELLLEAHYFSGGLRVSPLAVRGQRPDWAPAQPDRLVGLRSEFALAAGDRVVEFARLAPARRPLTWVAVYRRSIDREFGDRSNHAGVGLWLLEHDVREPYLLLDGLDQLAQKVADAGPSAVDGLAISFSAPDFLPRYVQRSVVLPAPLGGVPFPEQPVAEPALFQAGGEGALRAAADHLSRMSLLPPGNIGSSRALILLRPSEAVAPIRSDVTIIKETLRADLMEQLPLALMEASARWAKLEERALASDRACAARDTEIAELRAALAAAEARIGQLEADVAESDLLARLARIDSSLGAISNGLRRSEDALQALNHDVRAASRAATSAVEPDWRRKADDPGPQHGGRPSAAEPLLPNGSRRGWAAVLLGRNSMLIGIGIVAILLVCALLYFALGDQAQPEPAARERLEVEYR